MKRKEAIIDKIPENHTDKLDLIVEILNRHLTQNNKKILFETLKEIQKDRETSLEFIKYLFIGTYKRNELKNCEKDRIKKVNKIIRKFRKLLKESNIPIELKPVTYYSWSQEIDLIKSPKQRFLKFFKI